MTVVPKPSHDGKGTAQYGKLKSKTDCGEVAERVAADNSATHK